MPRPNVIDAELLQRLGWTNIWEDIQRRVCEEVDRARRVAPLLPRWVDEKLDPDGIPNCTLKEKLTPATTASPEPASSIPVNAPLVSVEIASEFSIGPSQFGQRGAAIHLVSNAANRVALAEDAVLLYGKELLVPGTVSLSEVARRTGFDRLHVRVDNLDKQDQYLYKPKDWINKDLASALDESEVVEASNRASFKNQAKEYYTTASEEQDENKHPERVPQWYVWNPYNAWNPEKILKSILQGILELQAADQYGEYCVITSHNLYRAAFRSPNRRDAERNAPIDQIRPLLREEGFAYSPMALPHTAAILSLGGGALCVAVPQEAHISFVRQQRDIILSVRERIRLMVNDDEACRPLRFPLVIPASSPSDPYRNAYRAQQR